MATTTKTNEIASLFLVQALERTKERVTCYVEENNLKELDYVCNFGCVHMLLSVKQAQWLEGAIAKTQGFHRQKHTVSYEDVTVGTWAHREFNKRLYLDFELDAAFVAEYMSVDAALLSEARQFVQAKEEKYA